MTYVKDFFIKFDGIRKTLILSCMLAFLILLTLKEQYQIFLKYIYVMIPFFVFIGFELLLRFYILINAYYKKRGIHLIESILKIQFIISIGTSIYLEVLNLDFGLQLEYYYIFLPSFIGITCLIIYNILRSIDFLEKVNVKSKKSNIKNKRQRSKFY